MGSIALHGGVAALLLISWQFTRDLKVGSVTPVTIVSGPPFAEPPPALAAAETQEALTEAPVPDAALEAVSEPEPTPAPTTPAKSAPPPKPAPPPPTPAPKALPTKAAPVAKAPTSKAPAKAAAAKAEPGLDLDALAASLNGGRPSSAARGPARPATAPVARTAPGAGQAGLALTGLADELQRRWNPNCEVEGGRDVIVRVSFALGAGGQVAGDVTSQIRGAESSVSQAAADRAVRAVYAASPFRDLPKQFYGDRIAVNFNAREACATR